MNSKKKDFRRLLLILWTLLFLSINCSTSQQQEVQSNQRTPCTSSHPFFSDDFEKYSVGELPSQENWEFLAASNDNRVSLPIVTNTDCVTEDGQCLLTRGHRFSTQIGCYKDINAIYMQFYANAGLYVYFSHLNFSFVFGKPRIDNSDNSSDNPETLLISIFTRYYLIFRQQSIIGNGGSGIVERPSGRPPDLLRLYLIEEFTPDMDSWPSWYRFEFEINMADNVCRMRLRIYEGNDTEALLFGHKDEDIYKNLYNKETGIVSDGYSSSYHNRNTGDICMLAPPQLRSYTEEPRISSSRLDDFAINDDASILKVGFDEE